MKPLPFLVVLEVNQYLNGINQAQSLSTIIFLSSDYLPLFHLFPFAGSLGTQTKLIQAHIIYLYKSQIL